MLLYSCRANNQLQIKCEIAKTAYAEKRPTLLVASEMTDLRGEELKDLLEPLALTRGGIF